MDLLLELLKVYGLPTAFLVAISVAAWKMLAAKAETIKSKDEEIKRVNEARISEQQLSAKAMMEIAQEFTKLSGEQEKTLAVLADRMQR